MKNSKNLVPLIIIIGTWVLFAFPVLFLLNAQTEIYFDNAFRTALTAMLSSVLLIIPHKYNLNLVWKYASLILGCWIFSGLMMEVANWWAPEKHYNGSTDIIFGIRTLSFIGSFIVIAFAKVLFNVIWKNIKGLWTKE